MCACHIYAPLIDIIRSSGSETKIHTAESFQSRHSRVYKSPRSDMSCPRCERSSSTGTTGSVGMRRKRIEIGYQTRMVRFISIYSPRQTNSGQRI